jgi:signal transduction histidine kinase
MRNWRISTRLVSLLALPVVTAGALGGLSIKSSLDNINQLERMKTLTDITEHATDLAAALQEERDSSAGPLASGQTGNDAIAASRETTDRELSLYKNATDDVQATDSVYKGVRATLVSIGSQLADLKQIRDQAYTSDSGISQTVSQYDGLIQSLLSLSQDMAQATNNHEMIQATRALAAFSAAKEYESIQRAVISAAFATGGHLNANDYQTVYWSHENEKTQLDRFQAIYGGSQSQELLSPIFGGNDTITAHNAILDRIFRSRSGIDKVNMSYPDWDDAAKSKIQAMNQIERSLLNEMQQKALKLQNEAKRSALISGAIILLVLGVAVVGAFVVARSMVRSLRRLQQTAQDVAQKRLPELVKQLSESDPQDVDTSVESIGINSRDEIGQVARAFDEVHSEAVRLASEQALLRGNVNAMFTNLSRRSQGLIQRQLSLISELESREADPDQLSSLFKLDHLATRMRRNGENLLVLAGEEPGRRWTRPVPLVDVLRAAASEVEQYERIELTSVPSAEVTGRIVNDLVHLLAELLENATSFSSPQTKVRVTGHSLPDGRVLIEIHDTGIGLSPEDLADINERLANPPTVDVSVSRRMGLFVVGRLSLRHGIRIQLRPSDSGGTTALVMLPVDVTQGGAHQKSTPGARPGAAPAGQGGTGIAGAFGNTPRVGGAAQRGQVGGGAQRPAIGAGRPGGPGGPQQGGPRWAAQDSPQGGFPDDRGQDTPRGHEEVEAPAFDAFEGAGQAGPGGPGQRNDFPQNGRPGDLFGGPAQQGRQNRPGGPQRPGGQPAGDGMGGPGPQGGVFPPPQPQSTGPDGFRSDVFGGRPGPAPRQGGQGGPADTGQYPVPQGGRHSGDTGQFAMPQSGPGDTGQFSMPQSGPGDTGQFAMPQGGPGDTAQFPPVRDDDYAPTGQNGQTGQFPAPGRPQGRHDGARGPQGPQGWAPGGQDRDFQDPYGTGQFPVPQAGQGGPGDTAQIPVVRAEDSGEFPAPPAPQGGRLAGLPQRGPRGPQGTPGWTPNGQEQPAQDPYGTGPQRLSDLTGPGTGQYPVQQPQAPVQQPAPQQQSRPAAAGRPEQQLPPAAEPMALPPAPTRGDEPTPIFSSIESDWFRTGQAERMQQIHVEPGAPGAQGTRGQQAPPPRPVGRTAPPQRPVRSDRPAPLAQRGPQPAVQAPAAPVPPVAQPLPRETPNWRTSPNDALRRRAEQVREPSAGGVTPSGLPRRVPRANLVAGGAAQQQTPAGGPQVSRAPDDVRGRLTNLRRGIQQGRQAGGTTDGRGFGTNHQER